MMEPFSDDHQMGVMGVNLVNDSRVSNAVENGIDDVGLDDNGDVLGSGFVSNEVFRPNLVERPAIELVVDLNKCGTKECEHRCGDGSNGRRRVIDNDDGLSEKKGEYVVMDLVWGKVKSHPWWPGQIVDQSGSTKKVMKYFKKDAFLIAYFGDNTFAWNESCNIKPFRVSFCKFVGQSNDEAFVLAVGCALDEIARRVEFGLACTCLKEEVYLQLKSQVIVNDGIRKECSNIDGGDRFSTVDSFKPAKVVDILYDFAKDPLELDRLEVVIVGSQLSAFNRWKGYHQVQLNEVLNEADDKVDDDNHLLHSTEKVKARGRPRKRDRLSASGFSPSKKVRCLSDLMSNGRESVADGEYKPNKGGRKRKVSGSNGYSKEKSRQIPSANEFLSLICLVATNPTGDQNDLDSLIKFSTGFRNYRLREVKNDEKNVSEPETVEADGITGIKDSYWTDRIIVTETEEQVVPDVSRTPKVEDFGTALVLKFKKLDTVPPVKKLNEIFGRFGALHKSETRVLKNKKLVKMVFEKRADAETAFSSSGKFKLFGPALVSYSLDYKPTPRKKATDAKKGMKSARAIQFEK
uniref:uncharacterized protein LOC122603996 n=1 Tax=Erigeron canadensis TaxID=72917 RepID=UPI001CB8D1FB|nr:uncharacterized protein LOC122603996 [Erigeron canadensis]